VLHRAVVVSVLAVVLACVPWSIDAAAHAPVVDHPVVTHCPPTVPDGIPPSYDAAGGLGAALVPIRATSILVCRYPPPGERGVNRLVGQGASTDSTVVGELERAANAFPRFTDSPACPATVGADVPAWFVIFSDARSSVALYSGAGTCAFVTNARVIAPPTASWLDALTRLTAGHQDRTA
jgi:hypothetical protein